MMNYKTNSRWCRVLPVIALCDSGQRGVRNPAQRKAQPRSPYAFTCSIAVA